MQSATHTADFWGVSGGKAPDSKEKPFFLKVCIEKEKVVNVTEERPTKKETKEKTEVVNPM